MPVVRAHHGLGFHLGQDDGGDFFDFTDVYSPPDITPPPVDLPPSPINIVSSTPAPVFSETPVMPILAPAGSSSIMLPSNLQTVSYADGTKGFFDPTDGTYYDSQGNDVTGYAQNFGGAKITGTATAAQISAAEGISTPGAAPRVAAPTSAIPSPGALQSLTNLLFGSSAATMPKPATAAAAAAPAGTIAGMSSSTLLLLGGGLLAVVALMGRK